jgi:hypothetical protein
MSLLLGAGDGTFTPAAPIDLGPASGAPSSITVGDFDGNGLPDLAVGFGSGISLEILLNYPFIGLPFEFPWGTPLLFLSSADLNGDGLSDLVAGPGFDYGGGLEILMAAKHGPTLATVEGITLPSGTHQVVASYSGDSTYKPSKSETAGISAGQGTPIVSISEYNIHGSPGSYGSAFGLAAVVTGSGPAPSGTVKFFDGHALLGSATLVGNIDGNFVATLSVSGLAAGLHSATASYSGDSNYGSATSGALALVIAKSTPLLNLTAPESLIQFGSQATFAVTVAGGGAAPTGTVSFLDGTAKLGAGTLAGGTTTFSTSTLGPGAHTITANYGGDSNYNGATSSPVLVKVAGTTPSSVTLAPTSLTITNQQSVTVNIAVNGSSGQPTPTGTVALSSGSFSTQQPLNNGTASASIPAGTLKSGPNTVTASYGGDDVYAASSATTSVMVSQVAVQIAAQSAVTPGASVSATATLYADNTYSGTMNFACTLTGSPKDAQSPPGCFVFPASVTLAGNGTGTTVVTVKTTAATSSAVSRLSLWGLGGGALLACGFILAVPSRRRSWISALFLFVLATALLGCSGGGKSSGSASVPNTPATTAGNYTFNLVGTDSANAKLTAQTQFTVTVQ